MNPTTNIALTTGIATVGAVIFDMDGVLSDTQSIHAQVESDFLRQYGIELSPEEITREFGGTTGEEMFPRIFARYGKRLDHLPEIVERKWQKMTEVSRGRIRPMPGALDLVAALRGRGLPLALASSSRRSYIELVLDELGIRVAFQVIVSADEVAHSKPEPDIFLLAAERLGVPARFCLVIEDSVSGMRAAKSAGMYCIGLVPVDGRPEDFPAGLLVKSLQEVPLHFRS